MSSRICPNCPPCAVKNLEDAKDRKAKIVAANKARRSSFITRKGKFSVAIREAHASRSELDIIRMEWEIEAEAEEDRVAAIKVQIARCDREIRDAEIALDAIDAAETAHVRNLRINGVPDVHYPPYYARACYNGSH